MDDLLVRIMDAHKYCTVPTPLNHSTGLSTMLGCEVFLKCEHLQPTGSFKIRGATNKIRLMSQGDRERGVVTASTGNHGKAVAHAARKVGVAATVYVAAGAAQPKLEGIRALHAKLVMVDGAPIDAERAARAAAAESGRIYISPYNDFDVIAGQGTLGTELCEQINDLDAIFIAVGGGGLIGGVGTVLRALRPKTAIVGVWPSHSPCMLRALEAGAIVAVEERATLSDGTAGAIEPNSISFPLCQQTISDRIEVSESDIASAMRLVAQSDHWMVEGAAGAALAGLIQRAGAFEGRRVAVVLCGRNIALETFLAAVGI